MSGKVCGMLEWRIGVEQNQRDTRGREKLSQEEKIKRYGRIGKWFQTICFMNVPVVGFFYMLVMALRKNTPAARKDFAKAYLLYRILVLFLAVTILFVLYKIGLNFVDELLKYAKI